VGKLLTPCLLALLVALNCTIILRYALMLDSLAALWLLARWYVAARRQHYFTVGRRHDG
jgi:hypothetical protein